MADSANAQISHGLPTRVMCHPAMRGISMTSLAKAEWGSTGGTLPLRARRPRAEIRRLQPVVSTSAPPRCLDGGDVDLLHRHHCLERTLCLTAASRKRLG